MTLFIQNFMLTIMAVLCALVFNNWLISVITMFVFSFLIYWFSEKI